MEISNYLQGDCDYDAGVLLYDKHGNSSVLKSLFHSGENTYTARRLHEELEKLVPKKGIPFLPSPKKEIEDPPEITILRGRWLKLYKECSHHHAQLRKLTTDEERRHNAHFIDSTMMEVESIWKVVDHYDATGEVQLFNDIPKDDFNGKEKADLILIRNNKRVQQSKLKGKIDKGGKPIKLQEWQDKLIIVTQELSDIEKMIHGEVV